MSADASITHHPLRIDEFRAIEESAWFVCDVDFFGVGTRLHVRSAHEAAQWRHFFRHHLGERTGGKPVVEVWLEIVGEAASFLESVIRQDTLEKAIYVRVADRIELWSQFTAWSTVPSPIPPFQLAPLVDRVFTLNASCVRPAGHAGAILFAAPRYNGKSTLANAIVARGGAPLGDNLAVVDVARGVVLPYLTPTGIRAETVGKLRGLRDAIAKVPEDWVTVSDVTGPVYLVHFDDLHRCDVPSPTPIHAFIYPSDRRKSGIATKLRRLEGADARRRASDFLVTYGDTSHEHALGMVVDRTMSFELEYDLATCDVDDVVDQILVAVGG